MRRTIPLSALVCLLLVGCSPADPTVYVSPGWIYTRQDDVCFYIDRLPPNEKAALAADPNAVSEQRRRELLEGSRTSVVLPPEITAQLVEGATWSAPPGVTIVDPEITISPATMWWQTTDWIGNTYTYTQSVERLRFTWKLTVEPGATPVRGALEVTLPNFTALEPAGLYLLRTDCFEDVTGLIRVYSPDASGLIESSLDRPRYSAIPEVFYLREIEIVSAPTALPESQPTGAR